MTEIMDYLFYKSGKTQADIETEVDCALNLDENKYAEWVVGQMNDLSLGAIGPRHEDKTRWSSRRKYVEERVAQWSKTGCEYSLKKPAREELVNWLKESYSIRTYATDRKLVDEFMMPEKSLT